MKNFNFGGSLKNPIFRVGLTKNQYRGGNCLKRGAWTVCRFKGETMYVPHVHLSQQASVELCLQKAL